MADDNSGLVALVDSDMDFEVQTLYPVPEEDISFIEPGTTSPTPLQAPSLPQSGSTSTDDQFYSSFCKIHADSELAGLFCRFLRGSTTTSREQFAQDGDALPVALAIIAYLYTRQVRVHFVAHDHGRLSLEVFAVRRRHGVREKEAGLRLGHSGVWERLERIPGVLSRLRDKFGHERLKNVTRSKMKSMLDRLLMQLPSRALPKPTAGVVYRASVSSIVQALELSSECHRLFRAAVGEIACACPLSLVPT